MNTSDGDFYRKRIVALENYCRELRTERDGLRAHNDTYSKSILDLCRQLAERIKERDALRREWHGHERTLDSIHAKTERLWQWARENLTGDIADQFWQITANGSLMTENPEYHQRISVLRHDNEALRKENERLLMRLVTRSEFLSLEENEFIDKAELERDGLRTELATCNQALAVAQARINVLEGVVEAANEFIFSLDTEPAHVCKCGKCKGDGNE